MTMKKISLFLFAFCLVLAGCGGGASTPGISFSQNKGDAGYLQLNVSGSRGKSFSERTRIDAYKVILEGEGLARKEETLPGGSKGLLIDGIPAGPHRTITIQGLNVFGEVLREGSLAGLNVEKGKRIQADVVLQAIPLSLNFKEEDHWSNQRLYFHLFSDPGHLLSVKGEEFFQDVAAKTDRLHTSLQGEAKFYPGPLPAGNYRFEVLDRTNGRSRVHTLHLWDGTKRKGAPLFSAGLGVSRLGQPLARPGGTDTEGGEFFPNIRDVLWKLR